MSFSECGNTVSRACSFGLTSTERATEQDGSLPDPARVITTTNSQTGVSSIYTTLSESLPVTRNLGGTHIRLAYVSDRAPQPLNGNGDLAAYGGFLENVPQLVVPGGGSTVWYIDLAPGSESPLHRTVSLDFVFLIEGELELMIDSGETRMLRPGDTVIQRGTMHQWKNHSKDKWVRMIAVMAQCEPIVLDDGTELGSAGLG
ncbi:cupin domain protein [Xylaria intraflava]|nr:cupin domain protein [Xylaria intraflava]